MLQTLKQKPLLTSLLIVLLYACWFLSPLLFGTTDSPIHATKTMASAVIVIRGQVIVIVPSLPVLLMIPFIVDCAIPSTLAIMCCEYP